MKLFQGHKKRVRKVKDFAVQNKIFMVMLALAAVFLLANFIFIPKTHDTPKTAEIAEEHTREWRFYPIDLAVLGVGGGFCTVMILRERKRVKEDTNYEKSSCK